MSCWGQGKNSRWPSYAGCKDSIRAVVVVGDAAVECDDTSPLDTEKVHLELVGAVVEVTLGILKVDHPQECSMAGR